MALPRSTSSPCPSTTATTWPALPVEVSYGWGMIPVSARIGGTNWTTSLFPKDGGYIVPIKDKVRNAEGVQTGDPVTVFLTVDTG